MSEETLPTSATTTASGSAQQVARTTALLVVRRGLITILSGVATLFVARALQPEQYGLLQSALATWTLVTGATDFGFSLALSRDFARKPRERAALLRAAYFVQLSWSTVLALGLTGLAFSVGLDTSRGLCLLILAPSVLFTGLGAARVLFTSIYDVSVTVRIDLVTNAAQLCAMIGLAAAGAGPVGVAAAVAAGTAATFLWIALAATRVADIRTATGRGPWRELLRTGLPLGVMAVLSKVYVSIDLALLAFYVTGNQLGFYAAAAKIVLLLNMLPQILLSTALPALATNIHDKERVEQLIGKVLHWACALILPILAAVILFPRLILRWSVGAGFVGGAPLLAILAVAATTSILCQLVGYVLIAYDVIRPMLWQNLSAVVLNVGLNVALIPIYGAYACAWITAGTELYVLLFALVTLNRRTNIAIRWAPSARSIASVGISVAFSYVVPAGPVVSMFTGGAAYIAATTATRAWPLDLIPARLRRRQ